MEQWRTYKEEIASVCQRLTYDLMHTPIIEDMNVMQVDCMEYSDKMFED